MKFLLSISLLFTVPLIQAQNLRFNEMMAANESVLADENGDYSDWIELYNAGSTAINLAGYGISDMAEEPYQWIFPSVEIAAGGFLLVFCSEKDTVNGTYLHTNFKIKSSGEALILTDNFGQTLDELRQIPLGEDFSYGRITDGLGYWERFSQSTPNASNQTVSSVTFSHLPGHYPAAFNVSLTSSLGHSIYYTLDGSVPDQSSFLYTAPINVANLAGMVADISTISTSSNWSPPTGNVHRINVIRAQAFNNGNPSSLVYGKTYMIGNEIEDYYQDLPIISILTDSLNLFSYDTGIFVQGVNYNPANSQWTGNYFQKGIEWERDAYIEYFQYGNLIWSQQIGVRTQGGGSRRVPQKSLRLYARNEKGAKKFNHQFFETKDKQIYDKVILRAHFSCWNRTMIKDEVTGYLARNLDFDSQHSQPAVVFINGEYWGLYAVRDYYDSNYIEEEHGVEKDSVSILLHGSGTAPNWGVDWGIVEGSNTHYLAMLDFIDNNPLSSSANYEYVTSQMDMSSFIDYYCTEIYFNNRDWPSNNHKIWQSGGDEKWRWLLYDFDSGWGYTSVNTNTLVYASHPTGSSIYNTPYTTFLFRNLLQSDVFIESFTSRYACLMNNEFLSDTVELAIDRFVDFYDNGVQQNIDRWHFIANYNTWNSRVSSKLYSFNNNRRQAAIQHVSNMFGINFNPDNYDCNGLITDQKESIKLDLSMMVYPNPANEFVWIDLLSASPNAQLTVFDISGRTVLEERYSFHYQLDVSNWKSGIYFALVQEEGKRTTKKFVAN